MSSTNKETITSNLSKVKILHNEALEFLRANVRNLVEGNSDVHKIISNNDKNVSEMFEKTQSSTIYLLNENRNYETFLNPGASEIYQRIRRNSIKKHNFDLSVEFKNNPIINNFVKEKGYEDIEEMIKKEYVEKISDIFNYDVKFVMKQSEVLLNELNKFTGVFNRIYNINSLALDIFRHSMFETLSSYDNVLNLMLDSNERIFNFKFRISSGDIVSDEQYYVEREWLLKQTASIESAIDVSNKRKMHWMEEFKYIEGLSKADNNNNEKSLITDFSKVNELIIETNKEMSQNRGQMRVMMREFLDFCDLLIKEFRISSNSVKSFKRSKTVILSKLDSLIKRDVTAVAITNEVYGKIKGIIDFSNESYKNINEMLNDELIKNLNKAIKYDDEIESKLKKLLVLIKKNSI
ncbi:MAG: hypothetical protein HRS57_01790 [Mycoplasmataceae bacterium]|nr:hypothetical protein [Mycoplasmataceae bacterium]